MPTLTEQELMDEIVIYRKIIRDSIWMARRYADGRDTYTPQMVEEALEQCAKLHLFIDSDKTLKDKRWENE